jgi:hypothetical protein
VPLIAGEFGESVNDTTCGVTKSNILLDWLDQHNASYLAWVWNTWGTACGDLSLILDFAGTPHAPNGTNYKARLASGSTSPTPTPTSTSVGTATATPTSTPSALAPVAPSNLTARRRGARITLAWSDQSTTEATFRVERSTDNFSTVVALVAPHGTVVMRQR